MVSCWHSITVDDVMTERRATNNGKRLTVCVPLISKDKNSKVVILEMLETFCSYYFSCSSIVESYLIKSHTHTHTHVIETPIGHSKNCSKSLLDLLCTHYIQICKCISVCSP